MDHHGVDEEVEIDEEIEMDEELEEESDELSSGSEETEDFDITLAATHSYMGKEMEHVSSQDVLEAGWKGRMPGMLHQSCVFPGETVPLLAVHPRNISVLAETIKKDNLFALLSPSPGAERLSGFGVVCSMFEVDGAAASAAAGGAYVSYKARALHRCRVLPPIPPIHHYTNNTLRPLELEVLPELASTDALHPARLTHLRCTRDSDTDTGNQVAARRRRRAAAAAGTPWPLLVFDQFDVRRMRDTITQHFTDIGLDKLAPSHSHPTALSFWTARNLALAPRDQLALFSLHDALARLHMACGFISWSWAVCCRGCNAALARRRDVFAMSSDGVHNTYANPGGYMHDIATVSAARGVTPQGAASAEYSWFPGYSWTVLVCNSCHQHVGWRFEAMRRRGGRALRPALFYGLHRHYRMDDDL